MIGRFFIRFNLHNSVCNYPASFEVLRPMVDISDEELRACLDEIQSTHQSRAERLRASHGREINAIRGKRVLFLGDSLTSDNFGYRRTVTAAAELCALDGAVSGGTSSTILHPSKQQLASFKPDIVSLMIGTNDSVCIDSEDLPQVGIKEYERNVRAIVGWARESGARILLFDIPHIHKERFTRSFTPQHKLQSPENIQKYNTVLKGIAQDFSIPLFSNAWTAEGDVDKLFEPDGIHLSLSGHELFAEKWLESAAQII